MIASVTGKPVSTLSTASAEKDSVRTGEMKMWIRKNFLPCFLLVIALLCFVFLSPAFAEFLKINECLLARTNASLTGQMVETPYRTLADEESECIAKEFASIIVIPAEGEHAMNEGILFSIHDDYGYNWLQNLKFVGDMHYEASAASFPPLTVVAGRDGGYGADTTYVTMGLGSQEVGLDSWDKNVILGSEDVTWCGSHNVLCSVHLDGLSVTTNGSSHVTLYKSDSKLGIGVNVDATIDRISLATLSLGDCDGFKGTNSFGNDFTNAGYFGLKDTNITGVTASGSLAISVARVDGGVKSVHMGIDDLNVDMSSLDTTVVLGNRKDFSGTTYVLGTLYMNNLKMSASGYMDIYNPANNAEATTLGFGLKIPLLTLANLSWGDADGYTGTNSFGNNFTHAGYRGWTNLTIRNLAIGGQATFDMETVQAGDSGNLPIGTTSVNVGLSNLNVSMAYMTRDVALGDSPNNLNQVLRSVSWSNVSMDINGSVQISPH